MEIIDAFNDRQTQVALLAAVATAATALTFIGPMLQTDPMRARAKRVADYKENLRKQSRAELSSNRPTPKSLRNASAQGMGRRFVEQFKLLEIFDAESARRKLVMAGMRGERPVFTFMLARVATPVIAFLVACFYIYVLEIIELGSFMKMVACGGALVVGYYLPLIYVSNAIQKRQQAIQFAFPDSLDLMLICVESGMSIEAALQKVTTEVATACPELSEEYGLTTAELSYLQDRKIAYSNLGERTGVEGIKAVVTALIQSESYGTPLGHALRVMASENRDLRMQAAEKKAAALPPKLTVPMILFFLPVLFVVILGPGVLTAMGKEKEESHRNDTTHISDGTNAN